MPQPFLDITFPNAVARGATGGPGFSTNVVTLGSGSERRNIQWSNGRGEWNISTGIRTRAEMQAVIAHFYVVKGRGYSFRFKDWNDYQAADVAMVQVTPTLWQLVKRYNIGGYEHSHFARPEQVKAGYSIFISPEGTRNHGKEMLPFKEGSFKVAEKTGCAIIPVALTNTDDIFENHVPRVKATKVVIEFGKPIYPNQLDKEQRKKLGSYVQNIIKEMLDKYSE